MVKNKNMKLRKQFIELIYNEKDELIDATNLDFVPMASKFHEGGLIEHYVYDNIEHMRMFDKDTDVIIIPARKLKHFLINYIPMSDVEFEEFQKIKEINFRYDR